MSRQEQSASDGAIQAQAGGDVSVTLNQGLTGEALAELIEAVSVKAASQYAALARDEALVNTRSFVKILVQELVGIGRLEILADPAFLHLLDKANIKAATTKEPTEHEMLANLLAERSQKEDKPSWAAIDRAVEVVTLLDARALTGLTVMDAAFRWSARSPNIDKGLKSLDDVFRQILIDDLPKGDDWLDHLDSEDCIRITGVTGDGFIPHIDWMTQNHPTYVCRGFSAEQEGEYLERFSLPPFLPMPIFVPHELLAGQFRPIWAHHARAKEVMVEVGIHERLAEHVEAVALQDPALTNVDDQAKSALVEAIKRFPNLQRLSTFWDEIPLSFRLTRVGRVIARANARQLDKAGAIPVQADE